LALRRDDTAYLRNMQMCSSIFTRSTSFPVNHMLLWLKSWPYRPDASDGARNGLA
jgi:hypothetical protein